MNATLSPPATRDARSFSVGTAVLIAGVLALALPTLYDVGRGSWSSEQGAHGPIVLGTGLWLLWRELGAASRVARPGSFGLALAIGIPLLLLFVLARVTGIVEIEGYTMFACLLTAAYALWGAAAMRVVWFPLLYLLFIFPPPDTLFAIITQPLKIEISQWSVKILHLLGYPIAGSGVTIQIGQYEMLVAAACAGMNSLISLTALGLFYVYIRHNSNWRYMLVLLAFIVPVAIFANLIRVLILLLITYHAGEAAGQGFFHDLAGLSLFFTALIGIYLLDLLLSPIERRLAGKGAAR